MSDGPDARIALEEHAQDWLYALGAGIPAAEMVKRWEVGTSKPRGWWWRQMGSGTLNHRRLIDACAWVDWHRYDGGSEPERRRCAARIATWLGEDLGAGGLCGDEYGTTYAHMHLHAVAQIARHAMMGDLSAEVFGLARTWLARLSTAVRAMGGYLIGPRSKRDRHPQVSVAVEMMLGASPAWRSMRAPLADFKPGSLRTNRGLYCTQAVAAGIAEGKLGGIVAAELGDVRLRHPVTIERWPDGTTAAWADGITSYDGAQVAAVWGGRMGPPQQARHPAHGFVPDRPIRVRREPGRIIAEFRGFEHRATPNRPAPPRADRDVVLAAPSAMQDSIRVIG